MARSTQDPKKFIISCRINTQEMENLRELADESGMSITMLLRKSIDLMTQNPDIVHRA